MASLPMDADCDALAALLADGVACAADDDDDGAAGADGDDDDDDDDAALFGHAFAAAEAIVVQPVRRTPLGMPRQSPATAAFARKGRQMKRTAAELDSMRARCERLESR